MKINTTSIKKLFSVSILAAFLVASFNCCSNGSNQTKGNDGGEPMPAVDMGGFCTWEYFCRNGCKYGNWLESGKYS